MKYAIVTTTYNDETGIGKYIENILMQTILPVELIIAMAVPRIIPVKL